MKKYMEGYNNAITKYNIKLIELNPMHKMLINTPFYKGMNKG